MEARTLSVAGPLAPGAFACWQVTAVVWLAFLDTSVVGCVPRPRIPGGWPSVPETGWFQSSLVRATTPGAGDAPGVVAYSDVDPIPDGAGQGGGTVVGHDGGHSGVNPSGALRRRDPAGRRPRPGRRLEAEAVGLPVEPGVREGRDAWSAGPYCWRGCCPDPGARLAGAGCWRVGGHAMPHQSDRSSNPRGSAPCERANRRFTD
jgi:hypothetical protein